MYQGKKGIEKIKFRKQYIDVDGVSIILVNTTAHFLFA